MKAISTILILIFSVSLFAQPEVAGDYALRYDTKDDNVFEYKLTLSQDGTFFFHYYSKIKQKTTPGENKYGKGKWTVENNIITFFSEKDKHFDDKHTLDFTNSKARFIFKSPRDKTDRVIKTRIKFLNSEISWMVGIEMLKI